MIKDFDQLSLKLSQGHPLYDKIVPKNHPLRLTNEHIDFSFITPLLEGLSIRLIMDVQLIHPKSCLNCYF